MTRGPIDHPTGTTSDSRFQTVAELFDGYLQEEGFSGQLAIRLHGEPVVDLAGGSLEPDSLTGVFSVTKGIAALVIARLIEAGDLDLDAPVTRYWREFGAQGKDAVTVRQLLSHQAGLPVIPGVRPLGEMLDSGIVAAALAAQHPLWPPGTAFGYHGITVGVFMEELVRRIRGTSLQDLFETEIRAPRGADFYLGLPDELDTRYVDVGEPVLTPQQLTAAETAPPPDELLVAVLTNFDVAEGVGPDGLSANNARIRRAGPAAVGGVGSARGLARLYADTLAGSATPIARPETFEMMAQQQSRGHDRVLDFPNAFGTVFMLPQSRMPFGGPGAFGHDGLGGALAFADPSTGLAFGYIPAPMQYPGGADHRAIALASAAGMCARRANGYEPDV